MTGIIIKKAISSYLPKVLYEFSDGGFALIGMHRMQHITCEGWILPMSGTVTEILFIVLAESVGIWEYNSPPPTKNLPWPSFTIRVCIDWVWFWFWFNSVLLKIYFLYVLTLDRSDGLGWGSFLGEGANKLFTALNSIQTTQKGG